MRVSALIFGMSLLVMMASIVRFQRFDLDILLGKSKSSLGRNRAVRATNPEGDEL
jgi:hypothetical protein